MKDERLDGVLFVDSTSELPLVSTLLDAVPGLSSRFFGDKSSFRDLLVVVLGSSNRLGLYHGYSH